MSEQKEKLRKVIIENLEIDLDEKYIINQEKIQDKNIIEVISIKIFELNVDDMESFLALGESTSISSLVVFDAKYEDYGGSNSKIFEFKCNLKVIYNQNEQTFILNELGSYLPVESTISRGFFSQHL